MAAERHGLEIVARDIEDEPEQHHPFPGAGAGRDRVLRARQDLAGAIGAQQARRPAGPAGRSRDHGIGLSKLESRPARSGAWEYVFFIDLEGHQQRCRGRRAP
jgi:chorismate mutase/prephenate dehydratase